MKGPIQMTFSTFTQDMGEEEISDRLVSIAVVYSLPEAAVIRATLTAHGIPCFAFGEHIAHVQWYYTVLIGGISICVPECLKDQAIALIPDLAEPRPRQEIIAEAKANDGFYGRDRLIIAHLIKPVTALMGTLLVMAPFIPALWQEDPIGSIKSIIGAIVIAGLSFFSI